MRNVSIIGTGQLAVKKKSDLSLRQLAANAVSLAMESAGVTAVDALFAGNMLGDELQGQKHLAALIADEAGLRQVEALEVRAATASGAAALRAAYLAVASGQADLAVAVGVEKMSHGEVTSLLAKSLDAEEEVAAGATMISQSAALMTHYLDHYQAPEDALVSFSVNAHHNARHNPNALFQRTITAIDVKTSRFIQSPIRLLDCSPICDGAAAVVLAPRREAPAFSGQPVHILASTGATDRFRLADRRDPLFLTAAYLSAAKAFHQAGISRDEVSLFEVHDAFSIVSCLLLEAVGFATRGQGWRLAMEGEIGLNGRIPITTMGGLKARGHPIGATALYQACEMVAQLSGRAGPNQLPNPRIGLMQSVGGVASTVITHIFGNE